MQKTILLCLALVGYLAAHAQIIQKSNVYVFDLKQYNDSTFQLSQPRYLTAFNSNGYNNHPAFFSKNELCLSVQTLEDRQPDLYLFDLEKKTKTRLTQTAEGEYSAFPMGDGYRFSAVRQEYGRTDSTLTLWEFPIDRLHDGRPIFKYIRNIGYYQWLNSSQVAAFFVGNPNSLAIVDVRTDSRTPVATNVGRCFRKLPNGNLAYVSKSSTGPWELKQKKLIGQETQEEKERGITIAETLPGVEDFAVLPDGSFLMGKSSRLYHLNPRSRNPEWKEISNLQFYRINNITRLALSDDMKLAIVAE
ncbi:MAG TPA: hypothetical protein PKC76_03320 [Saprospiraceae bacterium]|nr:hypothetical protein [Saprospiraceae bacterium]HMP23134.1 hypothetical protein [Saprospiraceae bacterium]